MRYRNKGSSMKKLILLGLLFSALAVSATKNNGPEAKTPGHVVAGIVVGFVGNRILDRTVGPAVDRIVDGIKNRVIKRNGPGPKVPGAGKDSMSGWGSMK